MANNYTLASFVVLMTEDQTDYAMDLYEKLEEDSDKSFLLAKQILDNPQFTGFRCTKEREGVWISHNDSIDVENAAAFVYHLILKFDLPPVEFTWAEICDIPRLNEFSGGGIHISKENGIQMWTPYIWFEQLRNAK